MFPKGPSLSRLAALLALLCIALIPATAAPQSRRYLDDERLLERVSWPAAALKALGSVRAGETADEAASNILSFYVTEETGRLAMRVSMVQMQYPADGRDHFAAQRVRVLVLMDTQPGGRLDLPEGLEGSSPIQWDSYVELDPSAGAEPAVLRSASGQAVEVLPRALARVDSRRDILSASFELPAFMAGRINPRPQSLGASSPVRYYLVSVAGGQVRDRLLTPLGTPVYEANVDFVNHGNQGLAYSDVFHGRSGAESTSGFDDILAMHQNAGVPGNFHVGGLIQTSAQWNFTNGDPYDFNGTLRAGVTAGWAAILTSAYSQHIMPFATDGMNNWSIDREKAMVTYRYNYNARVAWVPERVWLSPTLGPTGGVVDWMGDNFKNHGVDAVILDDNIHGQGYDNHQIHTMAGTGLRVILRDNNFTGKMHAGDGAGALAVLTGLASSGLGTYRLVTYADDWEMAAAMGNWATDMPYAYGTYQYMITKCQTESAWLHAWKLDPALDNPNFNGNPAMNVTYGTYGSIGGTAGYGGSNNAWYTDWAAFVPYVTGGNGNGACDVSRGGNCMNHGSIWNTTQAKLSLAPSNNISEAGWYVMMSNLHEEGWHDYLGGPISGWQRNYSAHIKNAKIYAEAARWAGGLYVGATGAYLSDIEEDGFNELVMYNDRVFAVFETAGGRATQIFAKGPGGENFSVVGSDNAYWSGTESDFNDANHIAAFSDVGPNYQNDPFNVHVDVGTGNTVQATFDHYGVTKTFKLTLGQPYIDAV